MEKMPIRIFRLATSREFRLPLKSAHPDSPRIWRPEKMASRPQESAHEQLGKLGHPEYAQLRGMDQPVEEIAASHSFVEHHHVQKRHRCLVSDIRQMLEALFAGLRIKPRIRYALVH